MVASALFSFDASERFDSIAKISVAPVGTGDAAGAATESPPNELAAGSSAGLLAGSSKGFEEVDSIGKTYMGSAAGLDRGMCSFYGPLPRAACTRQSLPGHGLGTGMHNVPGDALPLSHFLQNLPKPADPPDVLPFTANSRPS